MLIAGPRRVPSGRNHSCNRELLQPAPYSTPSLLVVSRGTRRVSAAAHRCALFQISRLFMPPSATIPHTIRLNVPDPIFGPRRPADQESSAYSF